jgi:hypothetical protein
MSLSVPSVRGSRSAVLAIAANLLVVCVAPALAQAPDASRTQPQNYTAKRLVGPPPSIDGRLDDAAWKEGDWSGNYIQQAPNEGGTASKETRLKILYDDKHIYMAIRAYDDVSKVTKYPARRDSITGDVVGVAFDSLFDKRSAFEFDLNSAGTKIDLVLTNEGWDTTWDAVWDGKVAYEADAWTAEFRIPLSQLRYGSQDVQVWGMHSWRWIDRFGEEDQWTLIPHQGSGRLNHFGELRGIQGLAPHRRIELLPHVLGQVDSLPAEAGNPYVGSAGGKGAGGLDAKIGLTSNFTLDATVNPDFGQVEADPSVMNLTTYETFYEEKRPFFLEGKRIFTFGLPGSAIAGDASGTLQGDQMFYSRRIGAAPTVRPSVPNDAFLDTPGETSILSAVKVTGKTNDGLSVGLMQSVTSAEHAHVWSNNAESQSPVAPTANYVVGRVQKDWDKGNTILGGMFTSTHRWLPGDGPLQRLPTDAFTGAVDATHFFANRAYVVEGKGEFSRIGGDAVAIRSLQTNAVHYFQRPDADHVGVDANATSMLGHGGTVRVARYGNSKWLWSEGVRWMSPGFDLNDVGYLRQADGILNEAKLEFTEFRPRGVLRSYGFSVSREDAWDFGGLKTDGSTGVEGSASFKNLWGVFGGVNVVEASTDTRLLRGGPAMTTSRFLSAELGVHTDKSKRLSLQASAERHFVTDGGSSRSEVTAKISVRPTNTFNFSVNAVYERNVDDLQYVGTVPAAFSPKYLLGRLDQDTLGVTLRANLVIRPDLTIQYYGSPFVSNGSYSGFKRATTPRADSYPDRFHSFEASEIAYAAGSNAYMVNEAGSHYLFTNPDFDFRQFRSNLVARWEFKPGTSVYVVWSQERTGDSVLGKPLTSSLDALRQVPATNVLLVKLSYWFGL